MTDKYTQGNGVPLITKQSKSSPTQKLESSVSVKKNENLRQQRKTSKRPKGSSKKERCYHHVEISKLADAFEDQFFSHFAQTNQTKSDGQTQTYQADNLTVTTSKVKYDKCKSDTLSAINSLRKLSFLFMVITTLLLAVVVTDIILTFLLTSTIPHPNVATLQLILFIFG